MTALIGMRCRSASAGSATGQPTILPVVRSLYETSTSTVSFTPRGRWRAWSAAGSRSSWVLADHSKTRDRFAGRKTFGAEGGTRTPTGCPTRPSNVRVCQFRHFGALRGESISLSSSADNSADALAEPRVERVANPLAQEVVRQDRDEDREARVDRQPPADLDRVLALAQDVTPRGVRRLHAEPQKREPRLGEDRRRDPERDRHQHRGDRVGQDVAPDDAERAGADRLRPQDELALPQRQELGADEARHAHPAGEADDRHDGP